MYSFLRLNNNIYKLTDMIVLGKVNKSHSVQFLNMTKYENFIVLKINMLKSIPELSCKIITFNPQKETAKVIQLGGIQLWIF